MKFTAKSLLCAALTALCTITVQAQTQSDQNGIKVRFLGTGAADWVGHMKGDGFRRLTSILVDGTVLVDFTASDEDMLPDGCRPETIFYTHSHSDHFNAEAALKAGVRNVYLSETWQADAKKEFRKAAKATGLKMPKITALELYSSATVNGITFTALPANHATSRQYEQALIYLIEKDGTRLLYATDTGGIMAGAARAADIDSHNKEYTPIHGFIMEATMGLSGDEDFRLFSHSSVGTVLRTANMLLKTGRYTPAEGQNVYLTHLARTLHGTQAELDSTLPSPLKAAYDGLEVVFVKPEIRQ